MKTKIKKTGAAIILAIIIFLGASSINPGAIASPMNLEATTHFLTPAQPAQEFQAPQPTQTPILTKLGIIQTAHAQSADSKGMNELYNNIAAVINVMLGILKAIIWPILLLIGALLQNDILFTGGMEEVMLNIWVNIRNLVNILFILILLGIAFYNVVGGTSQDYHVKAILPKFIVALIAVNFSFLGVRVLADTVGVMTVAIFSLPQTVQTELQNNSSNFQTKIKDPEIRSNICTGLYGKVSERNSAPMPDDSICKIEGDKYIFSAKGETYFNAYAPNNAALVMAIDMGKILELDKVELPKNPADPLKALITNVTLSVAFYIIYLSGFIALFLVLLVRMLLLWVAAVLSPLIVLTFVLPESLKSSMGGGGEMTKKFVQSVIAPIPIALMMTIGFIMLQAFRDARFHGTLATGTQDMMLLTSGISSLQDLVASIGMVAVVWMGVFAAANGTYAEKAVNAVKGAVEGAGKFVATAPFKYLPIIPIRKADGTTSEPVSIGTAMGALGSMPRVIENAEFEKQNKLAHELFGITPPGSLNDVRNARDTKSLLQATENAGRGVTKKDGQQALAVSLKNNPRLAAELAIPAGYKNSAELLTALEAGNANPDKLWDALRNKASSENIGKQDATKVEPAKNTQQQVFNRYVGKEKKNEKEEAVIATLSEADRALLQENKNDPTKTAPLGHAILSMDTTWEQAINQNTAAAAIEFARQARTDITAKLQATGQSETEAAKNADEFIVKVIENRMNGLNPTEKATVKSSYNKPVTEQTPDAAATAANSTPPAQ
jgi:hypothetical protein